MGKKCNLTVKAAIFFLFTLVFENIYMLKTVPTHKGLMLIFLLNLVLKRFYSI